MKKYLLILTMAIGIGGEFPFEVGEELIYSAVFNRIPAGGANLSIISIDTIKAIPVYNVRFTAETKGLPDKLYKIRDEVNTWLGVKNLATYQQNKSIHEGRYKRETEWSVNYNQAMIFTKKDTIPFGELVIRDMYSLFYYFRTLELTIGDEFEFSSFDQKKISSLHLRVSKNEDVVVKAGKFNCNVVKPYKKDYTLFKNEGDMTIWFSNDTRKLPVKILIKLKFGSMLLKLESFN